MKKEIKHYQKIRGLVVSDGVDKPEFELPVYHLSEIVPSTEEGVILAVGEFSSENPRRQIISELRSKGFSNIFYNPKLD